jgi:drug/metabolite transporter (DMT)-like permease
MLMPTGVMKSDRLGRRPRLLLLLAALFWAGNTVASRLAVDEISPFMLVFLRWVLVIGVLWPIYGSRVRAQWDEVRARLGRIVAMSGLGFTGFNALYYLAAYGTSAINIGILQGSMPIFVLAGAFLAHGTRPAPMQLLGVLITVFGVVLVATRGVPLALFEIGLNAGDLAMLAACVLYAFYTISLGDRPPLPDTAFFTLLALVATVTSLPLVILEALAVGVKPPTVEGLAVTLYVAVFPSCLAQLCYLRGVALIGPNRAGVFINLVPVFSALLAVVLLGEPFAPFHAIALISVLGGIWLAQRAPAERSDAR